MEKKYIRPESIKVLRKELSGFGGKAIPLFGIIDRAEFRSSESMFIDLQDAGLDQIEYHDIEAQIGSCVFIEKLLALFSENQEWNELIRNEYNQNQRNQIRLGGVIQYKSGRSGLLTALLALDANLEFADSPEIKVSLGDYLTLREQYQNRVLIRVSVPCKRVKFGFEAIRRTPVDLPIVCVGLTKWISGRLRVCLGGYGKSPVMVYDGRGTAGVLHAVKDAYLDAGDLWASSEYRSAMAVLLTERLVRSVNIEDKHGN